VGQLSEWATQQGEQLTQGETEACGRDQACHAAAEPPVRFPWQTALDCTGQLQATVAGAAVHAGAAGAAVHAAAVHVGAAVGGADALAPRG